MLLGALVAKQFIGEPDWIAVLAQTGSLIIGIGIAVELVSRKTGEAAYRAAIGVALGAMLLLGWGNAAVGIIGSADNDANRMYFWVHAVGATGALIVRLKPHGMAIVLLATALTQTLVTIIALVGRASAAYSGLLQIVLINVFFITLFVGSAVLFWKAGQSRLKQGVM